MPWKGFYFSSLVVYNHRMWQLMIQVKCKVWVRRAEVLDVCKVVGVRLSKDAT